MFDIVRVMFLKAQVCIEDDKCFTTINCTHSFDLGVVMKEICGMCRHQIQYISYIHTYALFKHYSYDIEHSTTTHPQTS